MKNVSLFKAEDLPPRARYEKLFENLHRCRILIKQQDVLLFPGTPFCELLSTRTFEVFHR
jgi:hypothetical protein